MSRRFRIKELLFHRLQCALDALPLAKAEIVALPPDAVVSFDTVHSVIDPSTSVETEHATFGKDDLSILQCSNAACDHKQRADKSRSGWVKVQMLFDN